ncbi:MAG TPA: penicillin acylase family protein, partial [Thermoleophilaceae bacterium]
MGRRLWQGAVVAGLVLAVLAVPGEAAAKPTGYHALIRRTAHGIPHITASSFGGLGYGYGYAFAQDNLCVMAEDYVTVEGERSKYFGPDGSYYQGGNGVTVSNLDSDFFFQQIKDSRVVDGLLAKPAPLGPKPEVKQAVAGYVAGYNKYLADVGGSKGVPDPSCRGKASVRPITLQDAYLRFYQLVELASGDVVIPGIAEAQPPGASLPVGGGGLPSLSVRQTASALTQKLPVMGGIGSNAVAIGKGGARDHKHGVLLGNPHFPWTGPERFYQAQMTIPGKIDVEGASLFGVPVILIGNNKWIAWSHTVSTAFRFTPFQLTLVPGSPTTYLYDGQPQQMTSRDVTVQVRQPDGSLEPETRTLYSSRFGPIFNSLEGVPLPWSPLTAFALADANADNFRVFNHFLDTDMAHSASQVLGILKKYEGIPWVNTIVADRTGHALYADIGAIPNVTNDKAQQCDTALGAATFTALGLPILDGSRSACNWGTDSDAIEPGLFGPSHLPQLFRDDYVTNSNDSYWLANPHQPLEGFPRIVGDERTARSLRTRIGLIMTQDQVDHGGFTRQSMQKMVFSDRQYAGELARDALVSMCRSMPGGMALTSSGPPVQVGSACDVLANWDLHENLDSRGAVLFRRFWDHASSAEPSPWSTPFDASDPVHTPNTLDTNNPQVRLALGDAINDLEGAHIPLDAAPGDVQKGPAEVPIHGGPGDPNGDFDAIYTTFDPGKGFEPVSEGSSYVQAVTWHDGPCPDARTILTYSLSTNPRSPFFSDQTKMFSRKQWVTQRFCASDV